MMDEKTALEGIEAMGRLGLISLAAMGLSIILIRFAPINGPSRFRLIGTFALGIMVAGVLALFTFDPAIRALKMVNSPAMFAVVGVIAAIILFALRQVRKDLYGFVEIMVAIGTLLALGARFDTQAEITVIVGFVGAIYVFVRGMTNVVEHWGDAVGSVKPRPKASIIDNPK